MTCEICSEQGRERQIILENSSEATIMQRPRCNAGIGTNEPPFLMDVYYLIINYLTLLSSHSKDAKTHHWISSFCFFSFIILMDEKKFVFSYFFLHLNIRNRFVSTLYISEYFAQSWKIK